jgi:hypothetical protein
MSDFDPYMKDGYKLGGQQTLLKPHEETQRKEVPSKPKPVGWETDAEWELEMRCANITENTPFAEVSKLINDLWQQYCLAAEPKPEATEGGCLQDVVAMSRDIESDRTLRLHFSRPVTDEDRDRLVRLHNAAISAEATEGGAHEKGWQPIETAPKGHRQDILIFDRGVVRIAWWGAAAYNRKTKEYDLGWTNGGTYGFQPSHWMPLPSAPAALTAKPEGGGE